MPESPERRDARAALRTMLATFYFTRDRLRTLMIDLAIRRERIPTEGAPEDIWTQILEEIEGQGEAKVDEFAEHIANDYSSGPLKIAIERYASTFLDQLPASYDAELRAWTNAVGVELPRNLDRQRFYYWPAAGTVMSDLTHVDRSFRVGSLIDIRKVRNLALIIVPRHMEDGRKTVGGEVPTDGHAVLFKWHEKWLDVLPSIDSSKATQETPGPWTRSQWTDLANREEHRQRLVEYRGGYESARHAGGLLTFKRSPTNGESCCYHYTLFDASSNIDSAQVTNANGRVHRFLSKRDIENDVAGADGRPSGTRYRHPNGDVFRALERLGFLDYNWLGGRQSPRQSAE